MAKRNCGNEQDLRVRPSLDAHSLDGDNPFTGRHPAGKDPCENGYGIQEDLNVPPPAVANPCCRPTTATTQSTTCGC